MVDYKVLYFKLFATCADVSDELDRQNYGLARAHLTRALEESKKLQTSMEDDHSPYVSLIKD